MSAKERRAETVISRYRSFRYALILEGVAVGVVSGVVVVGFRYLLSCGENLLHRVLSYGSVHPWAVFLWFAALAGASLLVAALLKWEPFISGSGIPQLEGEIMGEFDQCWWRVLIAKLLGGMLSLGCGLSLGREGPSIQLGAMAAKGFSRLTGRVKTEEKLLMTCGASAGLAAAFNAPIAGVLFSLEEIHKHFSPEILLSCMASSITADFVSRNVFGLKPVFSFTITRMMPLASYGHVLVLGILIGFLGVCYNSCLSKSQDLYQKIPRMELRLLLPFLLAGLFGLVYPSVLGGGHGLVEGLSSGEMAFGALILLFVLKFIFSMVSFGSGAPGGIFLPLLVLGAVIGSIYFGAVGSFSSSLDGLLGNFIILGMAGYFSAIVRAPITGIILISEMTGSFSHLLTLSMVSLAAYLVPDAMGCAPVYDQLLHRLLSRMKPDRKRERTGEKVLVECVIAHGSQAVGKPVSLMEWPETSLVVSLLRGEAEFVPRGDTAFLAGDRIVVLCDETCESRLRTMLQESCQTVCVEEIGKIGQ